MLDSSGGGYVSKRLRLRTITVADVSFGRLVMCTITVVGFVFLKDSFSVEEQWRFSVFLRD